MDTIDIVRKACIKGCRIPYYNNIRIRVQNKPMNNLRDCRIIYGMRSDSRGRIKGILNR